MPQLPDAVEVVIFMVALACAMYQDEGPNSAFSELIKGPGAALTETLGTMSLSLISTDHQQADVKGTLPEDCAAGRYSADRILSDLNIDILVCFEALSERKVVEELTVRMIVVERWRFRISHRSLRFTLECRGAVLEVDSFGQVLPISGHCPWEWLRRLWAACLEPHCITC